LADFTANVHGVAWAASTAYALNDNVGNDTSPIKIYKCITAGTSAGSGGPTGTGSDITDGGAHWAYQGERHYTSLNAALAGESYNLTTNIHNTGQAGILTIDCYNFKDTTPAGTGTGYTVDSGHYINIKAHDSHGGTWNESRYRLVCNLGYTYGIINVNTQYTRITGIQSYLVSTSNSSSTGDLLFNNWSYAIISKCIFRRDVDGFGGVEGLVFGTYFMGPAKIFNNIFIGGFSQAIRLTGAAADAGIEIYNNTFVRAYIGIAASVTYTGTISVKNNLFYNCVSDVTGTITDSYNATTNNNSKGLSSGGTGNRFSQTFTFADDPGSAGSITHVQSKANYSTSCSFDSNNTAGNTIIVGVGFSSSFPAQEVSDSKGNIYYKLPAQFCWNPAYGGAQIFFAKNIAAGPNTVTVSGTGTDYGINIHEYSGLSTVGPYSFIYANAAGTNGGSTTPLTGQFSTVVADSLIFVCGADESSPGPIYSAGTGYLGYTLRSSSAGHYDASEDYIATSIQSNVRANFTNTSNLKDYWSIVAGVFQAIGTPFFNFHLGNSDTGAKGYGVSDPGSGLFSDDIDGETRSGSWDIGADDYQSGAAAAAITGTIINSITEADIVTGGKTLIITLTGDTWIAN